MSKQSRREVLGVAVGGAVLGAAIARPVLAHTQEEVPEQVDPEQQARAVIASGLTREEAACWNLCSDLAASYFALEPVHRFEAQREPDRHEVVHAVHVIQNKLLARPTYRKYLDAMQQER